MARDRTKLGDAEVQGWLKAHPGWALEGGMIRRTFAFKDFRVAMAFVNRVADAAERSGPPPGHRHPLLEGDAGARDARRGRAHLPGHEARGGSGRAGREVTGSHRRRGARSERPR